jgi:hypothetical protein
VIAHTRSQSGSVYSAKKGKWRPLLQAIALAISSASAFGL